MTKRELIIMLSALPDTAIVHVEPWTDGAQPPSEGDLYVVSAVRTYTAAEPSFAVLYIDTETTV